MMIRGIVLFLFLLLAAQAVHAAKAKKAPLRWHESHGEIVLDSVCDDFAYGSIDYRDCRAATKRLFEERCRYYHDKADHASGTRRDDYWRQEEKYCRAASGFSAVN